MEKQISFSEGLVSQPYSDVCPDGQLSTMHGVEVHAGSVRPSLLLGTQFGLDGELVFIHKTGEYIHYLYKDANGNLCYKDLDEDDSPETETLTVGEESENENEEEEEEVVTNLVASASDIENLKNIVATGNILTFLCEDKELQYGIWRDNDYVFLGSMPDLKVRFALEGEEKFKEITTDADPNVFVSEASKNDVCYNLAAAAANEFVNYWCNKEGEGFVYPFFVRAAWKLYDGTYIQFSEPILMIPNTTWPCMYMPFTCDYVTNSDGTMTPVPVSHVAVNLADPNDHNPDHFVATHTPMQGTSVSAVYAIANVMKLQYSVGQVPEEWEGVISGLEIMISQPMPQFDFNYQKTDNSETLLHERENLCHGKVHKTVNVNGIMRERAAEMRLELLENNNIEPKYRLNINGTKKFAFSIWRGSDNTYTRDIKAATLQDVDVDAINDKLNSSDGFAFFHFKTIPYTEILKRWENGEYESDNNPTFVNLELQKGQYDSIPTQVNAKYNDTWKSNRYYPKKSLVYNNRLNIYDTKVKNFICSKDAANLPYKDWQTDDWELDLYVRLEKNGTASLKKIGSRVSYRANFYPLHYVFIPNTNVMALIIVNRDPLLSHQPATYTEIAMQKSVNMDGVYYYNREGFVPPFEFEVDFELPDDDEDIDVQKNMIYTSEVSNPFIYTPYGLNRMGSGEILRVAAMTKPLSEGQMGGFPLVAFCTDGNYGLSVIKSGDKAGLYDGVTPMRPDVCINADTVMGIEEGIFFVSQRGLMLLTENDAVLLSGKLDGVKDVFGNEDMYYGEIGTDDLEDFNSLRPRSYIEKCMPAWDYTNSRLLLLRKGFREAYMFKADDKTWSSLTLPASVKTVLNSYPFSYIQFDGDGDLPDGTVVVLDDDYNYDDGQEKDGLIVTRPIKMDSFLLKRINEFALQGNFALKQKITIYGSNDLRNWYCVGTTKRRHVGAIRGYYFKYWRFKIETKLKENENISGVELKYNMKLDGRLR